MSYYLVQIEVQKPSSSFTALVGLNKTQVTYLKKNGLEDKSSNVCYVYKGKIKEIDIHRMVNHNYSSSKSVLNLVKLLSVAVEA